MKNAVLWGGGIIVIVLIAAYLFHASGSTGAVPAANVATSTGYVPVQSSMGTFSYTCDNGDAMTMTPADDMSKISIGPNGAQSKFPDVTLQNMAATSGVRFEGQGITFTAHGETVMITMNGQTIQCNPLANPDMAPFNFGD